MIRLLRKLRIRTRLLVTFALVIVVMGYLNLRSMRQADVSDAIYSSGINKYDALIISCGQTLNQFMQVRIDARDLLAAVVANNTSAMTEAAKTVSSAVATFETTYNEFKTQAEAALTDSDAELAGLDKNISSYLVSLNSITTTLIKTDPNQAQELLEGEMKQTAANISSSLSTLTNTSNSQLQKLSDEASAETLSIMTTLFVVFCLTTISVVALCLVVSRSITTPLLKVIRAAREVSNGNLSNEYTSKNIDEPGQLYNDFGKLVRMFANMNADITMVSDAMKNGMFEGMIDVAAYPGEYAKLAQSVNDIHETTNEDARAIAAMLGTFANGDFELSFPPLAGDKRIISDGFETLRTNLNGIVDDIRYLSTEGGKGNLKAAIDTSKYAGDWSELADGLNHLLAAFIEPIKAAIDALQSMERGNMNAEITKEFPGEFANMRDALNATMKTVKSYVAEISRVLNEMSNENFDVHVEMNFIGDYAPIKASLETIIESINKVFADIYASAEQISAGARIISDSSMSLAQGATVQSASVEGLNAAVETINSGSTDNARHAQEATELAQMAQAMAANGQSEMKNMLNSMEQINKAAQNIENVIKVISEIAMQTNLLALNAAVEAAHAGEHGRGFTVVAEQVRALASRSQNATKETSQLINDSLEKVGQGTRQAKSTAATLNEIVTQIDGITRIIQDVAVASSKQSDSVSQILDNVAQIASVTSTNTATSEEEASSSQELSSQAEVFKALVGRFRLRSSNGKPKGGIHQQSHTSTRPSAPPTVHKTATPAAMPKRAPRVTPASTYTDLPARPADLIIEPTLPPVGETRPSKPESRRKPRPDSPVVGSSAKLPASASEVSVFSDYNASDYGKY